MPVPPATGWIAMDAPGVHVLAETSEKKARDWVVEFGLFRQALARLLPIDERGLAPVTVVLFRSDRQFRDFKPIEDGKPGFVDGYFQRGPERNLIVTYVGGRHFNARERICHETVHWQLSGFERTLPFWLEEGLAEVLSSFSFGRDGCRLGITRPHYVEYLKSTIRLPFKELAAVRPEQLGYGSKHPVLFDLFYAEAWATTHELLFSQGSEGMTKLWVYLMEAPGDDPEADFEQWFDRSPATMDTRLAEYLQWPSHSCRILPIDRDAVERSIRAGSVDQQELEITLGEALLGWKRTGDARQMLRRALDRDPNNGRALDDLGRVALAEDSPAEAGRYYEAARQHGALGCIGSYTLAEAILRRIWSTADPSDADVAEARELLKQAVRLQPRFQAGYDLLAELVCREPGDEAAVAAALRQGAVRYPRDDRIRLGWGFALLRHNEVASAEAQLAGVRGDGADPFVGEAIARLRAELQVRKQAAGAQRTP